MGEPRLALDPSDRSKRIRPVDYLFRSAVCHLRLENRTLAAAARELYPGDKITSIVLQERAASTAAMVGTTNWAGILAQQVVSDLLQAIVSLSAGAALLRSAQQISFDRRQTIRLPSRLVDAAYAGTWLAEGAPIPIFQFPISAGVSLSPKKLAVVCVFTREMLEQSNIEEFVRSLLSESAALSIDKALFSTAADDGVTPGGILAGLEPITAASDSNKTDNMTNDLGSLVQQLADNGGGAEPMFIAAPAQAIAMKTLVGPKFDAEIRASMALAAGTVVCVEPRSVVATINAAPIEFSTQETSLVQMADNPVDVVAGSPTKSLYQTDSTALKLTLKGVDWKLRAAHCAFVENVNW
jgi:hypothetical protein